MGLILGIPEYFCRPTDDKGDPIPYDELNPRVYLNFSTVAGDPLGRVTFRLSLRSNPEMVKNFCQLCTGNKTFCGKRLWYRESPIHTVMSKDGIIAGGDLEMLNGCGGLAAESRNFVHKNNGLKPQRGSLCMLSQSHKSDRFDSQFFILTQDPEKLEDGVCFGYVEKGMDVLDSICQRFGTSTGAPTEPLVISDCDQF